VSAALRAAVEWLSVADTRRMVQHGNPGLVYNGMRSRRPDKPRAVEHLRVIAETEPATVLRMCATVEREGTSGPSMFQRIDGRKAGAAPARPHDDDEARS
jgi:hypothetical protein